MRPSRKPSTARAVPTGGYGIAAVHKGKGSKTRLSMLRDVTSDRALAENIAAKMTESRVPYDQYRYIARDLAVENFV